MEEFTATQRKVIEWLALPKSKRKPKTQIQLGALVGVSDETISLWKRDPKFKQAVWELIEDLAGDDDADIIASVKRNAQLSGREGVQDRRLYLQWRGQLVDKQELSGPGGTPVQVEMDDVSQLSATERASRFAALVNQARTERSAEEA